jgi:hypothetical protein
MNIEYTKSLAGDKIVAKFPNHMVWVLVKNSFYLNL